MLIQWSDPKEGPEWEDYDDVLQQFTNLILDDKGVLKGGKIDEDLSLRRIKRLYKHMNWCPRYLSWHAGKGTRSMRRFRLC